MTTDKMKKMLVAIAAVIGCVGIVCVVVSEMFQMRQSEKIKGIIVRLAAKDIRSITIATNDNSESVLVGPDAVASFVEALKAIQNYTPNHSSHEKTFRVEVTTKDGAHLQCEFHKMYGDNEAIVISIENRSAGGTGHLGNEKSTAMFEWMRRQNYL